MSQGDSLIVLRTNLEAEKIEITFGELQQYNLMKLLLAAPNGYAFIPVKSYSFCRSVRANNLCEQTFVISRQPENALDIFDAYQLRSEEQVLEKSIEFQSRLFKLDNDRQICVQFSPKRKDLLEIRGTNGYLVSISWIKFRGNTSNALKKQNDGPYILSLAS